MIFCARCNVSAKSPVVETTKKDIVIITVRAIVIFITALISLPKYCSQILRIREQDIWVKKRTYLSNLSFNYLNTKFEFNFVQPLCVCVYVCPEVITILVKKIVFVYQIVRILYCTYIMKLLLYLYWSTIKSLC